MSSDETPLFETVDEMAGWFHSVDLFVEVFYRTTADLPWKVRALASVKIGTAEVPVAEAEAESIAEAFRWMVERLDVFPTRVRETSRLGEPDPEPSDGFLENDVDRLERWAEDLDRPLNIRFHLQRGPRWTIHSGQRWPKIGEGETLDEAVVRADDAVTNHEND